MCENYMHEFRVKLQSYSHEQNTFVARCDKNTRNDVSRRFSVVRNILVRIQWIWQECLQFAVCRVMNHFKFSSLECNDCNAQIIEFFFYFIFFFFYYSLAFIANRCCHILNSKSMSRHVVYDFVIFFVSLCKIINCWINTRVLCIISIECRPFIEKFDHFGEEKKYDQLNWHTKWGWFDEMIETNSLAEPLNHEFKICAFESKIADGQLIEYDDWWLLAF